MYLVSWVLGSHNLTKVSQQLYKESVISPTSQIKTETLRLQHVRLHCPLLSPRVCSNSCPLSQWCYLTTSSSATLIHFCLQFFPASGSFQMSQLFASGSQSIGVSASASLISLRMDWLDLLAVQGTLKSLLHYHSSKASALWHSAFFIVQLSYPYMTIGKNHSLD